ncbi:MAG TPA: S8 family serine peptidase [Candidatus Thermoplasmatota archaeon]|nr:S8 family serine peptidase [Candidatus Thermoplasmatota archaeon]
MGDRTLAWCIVAILVTIPLSGCTSVVHAGSDGYGETWPLAMIQADTLHERGLTGKGVKVAIIDTGIELTHKEFVGVPVEWADLVNGKDRAYDDNGHGTHVAGIIAAQGTWNTMLSGFRLKGVAPGVSLIVIKAIDSGGKGDETRVARGVNTAVNAGADIIVLSLGGDTRPIFGTNTEEAVRNAVSKGVYVVAAAGNTQEGQTSCTVSSPASDPSVIAVGAVTRDEAIGAFSCHGSGKEGGGSVLPGIPSPVTSAKDPDKKPEVVAPGVDITSTWKDGGYASATGTSQAAPMVGGILALLLEAKPSLANRNDDTVRAVKEKLMTTSKKIGPLAGKGPSAHDDAYGYGLIQGALLVDSLG